MGQGSTTRVFVSDLNALVALLPRCERSKSSVGRPKVAFPSETLARSYGRIHGQRQTYQCSAEHWHVATNPLNVAYLTVKPRDFDEAIRRARQLAEEKDVRMHVYGTKTAKGHWRYRVHPAAHRRKIKRVGEV